MGTQHLGKCPEFCPLNRCCALQTIRDRWRPNEPTLGRQGPTGLMRNSQRCSVAKGRCPPRRGREAGARDHGEGRQAKEEAKRYRCPAGTTPQCSRYIPARKEHKRERKFGVCVHSIELFLCTKRISAAARQTEGAFGHAEMSGTACIRKHAWGKNKTRYCANLSCLVKHEFGTELSERQENKEWRAYPAALLSPFS